MIVANHVHIKQKLPEILQKSKSPPAEVQRLTFNFAGLFFSAVSRARRSRQSAERHKTAISSAAGRTDGDHQFSVVGGARTAPDFLSCNCASGARLHVRAFYSSAGIFRRRCRRHRAREIVFRVLDENLGIGAMFVGH